MTTTPKLKQTVPYLSDRLQMRAAAMRPDKRPPVIRRIIEVRAVLAEQRQRGLSWAALANLLEQEDIHITEGTLRNYMRMIGLAEASLLDAGKSKPGDAEIHAALHARLSERPPKSQTLRQPQRVTNPDRTTACTGLQTPQPSLIRNTDRDL